MQVILFIGIYSVFFVSGNCIVSPASRCHSVLVGGGLPDPFVEGGDQPPKVYTTTGPRDSLSFDKVIEIVIGLSRECVQYPLCQDTTAMVQL